MNPASQTIITGMLLSSHMPAATTNLKNPKAIPLCAGGKKDVESHNVIFCDCSINLAVCAAGLGQGVETGKSGSL